MLGGCVSILSIAYVFYCYYVRGWHRYPNRLLLWRAFADLITAVGVTGFGLLDGATSSWGETMPQCSNRDFALNPAVLQFGFFASEVA